MTTIGGTPDVSNPSSPCYVIEVDFPVTGVAKVPVYFSQPEAIFKKQTYPFITINRDDMQLAMGRWMGHGQLEYRVATGTPLVVNGVSGSSGYSSKPQAMPYDIFYTISVWDRYEGPAQITLLQVLKAFHPVGRLIVYDSLNQQRSYEYYHEGSIASLQEIIDPVTRVRGYALSIKVEGELDLVSGPVSTTAVTGFGLDLYVMNE